MTCHNGIGIGQEVQYVPFPSLRSRERVFKESNQVRKTARNDQTRYKIVQQTNESSIRSNVADDAKSLLTRATGVSSKEKPLP